MVLAGASILNVVQFPSIEAMGGIHFDAVNRGATSDILDLTYHDLPWCRDRFGLSLALSAVAPDARVIVPTPSAYDSHDDMTENLLIWLRMAKHGPRTDWVAYAGAADLLSRAGVDPMRYAIATGRGGPKGAPWVVAIDPAHGPSPVTAPESFADLVVNSGYVAPDAQPGREFVLLRWDHRRDRSGYAYQDVLVETSLLPESIRRDLVTAETAA